MANISTHLNNIKNAVFGREVRSSIHDGIKAMNEEVEGTTVRQVDLENTFDQLIINAGSSNAEVVAARVDESGKSHDTLGKRLNSVDTQIKDIEKGINILSFYPKQEGETDYNRIIRAINATPTGGVLIVPTGTFDLGGNDITLIKPITLQGQGKLNTIFNNGGLIFEGNNINIDKLFVNCPTLDNAFQGNTKSISNIKITDCKGIARDHSFLFESYYGTVQNILVENCESSDSIHGFISKATSVKFINCTANNHPSGFGFGVISDNIPGSTNNANAVNNSIVNCSAKLCSSGLRSYVRDKHNSLCATRCSQNSLINFTVNNCASPIHIGEDFVPEGYQSIYQVEMFNINGVNEISKIQDDFTIKLDKTYRCVVDNAITLNGLTQTTNAVDNVIGNVIAQNKTMPITEVKALREENKVLNTSLNNCFEIRLNSSTEEGVVIDFTGQPKNGNIVTVLVRNAGKNNFGGFNTTNCLIDTTKFTIQNTNIPFNNGQISQWMYCPGLTKKWLCISVSELINLS